MSKPVLTHCALRLGDNLAHLHFLRALAVRNPNRQFIHYAHQHYLPQLIEVVCDLPNLTVRDLAHAQDTGVDAWKNQMQIWEEHPRKNDYAAFYLDFFSWLAPQLGFVSPFSTAAHLLFDYPGLLHYAAEPLDFLVVNSAPQSGQWAAAHTELPALDALAQELAKAGKTILTTRPVTGCATTRGESVTAIGAQAISARCIIAVSTGPSWPTFNVWSAAAAPLRILLIDHERINLAPNTHHAQTVAQVREILAAHKML